MVKKLFVKKLGMTRIIQDDGRVIPITLVECEPNEVHQVKTQEKDGYPAIVLGFSKLAKPKKTKKFAHLREVRLDAIFVMNISDFPFCVVSFEPDLTGKSEESVYPVKKIFPFLSKAISLITSIANPLPPK